MEDDRCSSRIAERLIEIHSVQFDGIGSFLHLSIDGADVFAHDPKKNQHEGLHKKQADDHRRNTDHKGIPEDQLQQKVYKSNQKGENCAAEARKGSQPQRHSGVIDDAQHADVIQRVPVVLGDTEFAGRLIVEQLHRGQTDFGDHAAEIGVRIVELADKLHHLAIIKPKAGVVLNGVDGGQPLGKPVVLLPRPKHH